MDGLDMPTGSTGKPTKGKDKNNSQKKKSAK